MEHLSFSDFLHNQLLVKIMKEYQMLNYNEDANLDMEFLWNDYRRLYYENRLNELREAANLAITFFGTIQR